MQVEAGAGTKHADLVIVSSPGAQFGRPFVQSLRTTERAIARELTDASATMVSLGNERTPVLQQVRISSWLTLDHCPLYILRPTVHWHVQSACVRAVCQLVVFSRFRRRHLADSGDLSSLSRGSLASAVGPGRDMRVVGRVR